MKTNSLFFTFFAAITFTQTPHIHGMLTRKTPQVFSCSKRALQARTCTRIVSYDHEKHKDDIEQVVFQNAHRLMRGIKDKDRSEAAREMMVGAINNKEMKSCVFLDHDTNKPLGVINYYFCDQSYQWLANIFGLNVPQNAVIQIIAVDKQHQGKKIGSTLLQHVLQDCAQQGIYKVSLGTISSKLEKFYEKQHGFTCTWYGPAIRSSYSEFAKWLQPQHPIVAAILMAWSKNKK